MNEEPLWLEVATFWRSRGFTYRQIGERLGISWQRVYYALNRDRERQRSRNTYRWQNPAPSEPWSPPWTTP